MMQSPIVVIEAVLDRQDHAETVLRLLDAYARDPMGDGQPLSAVARENLIGGLKAHPTTLVFIAYEDAAPVGLAICFRGFSTFAARPLVNVSDYYIVPAARGRGAGRQLLEFVERRARELGCCRLTLEVQENNLRARRVYEVAGFSQTVHVPEAGPALFLSKELVADEGNPSSLTDPA